MKFAIIGGSGFLDAFKGEEWILRSCCGSVRVYVSKIGKNEVIFLPRHGLTHAIPPHKVNYAMNMSALKEAEVTDVITTNACGIISKFKPGDFVLASDFMAHYLGPITLHDDFSSGVKHTDMSEPFSLQLNDRIKRAAKKTKVPLKEGGIIATAPGPRFETKAEIRAFKILGANLIGMTNAYEVILARELEMNIASIAVATNYACGLSKHPLTHAEVEAMVAKKSKDLKKLIEETIKL
ncbi:MAG: MTAP family purine nucleoside phosphorylase [Candidatus Micrarchaeota archaeon]